MKKSSSLNAIFVAVFGCTSLSVLALPSYDDAAYKDILRITIEVFFKNDSAAFNASFCKAYKLREIAVVQQKLVNSKEQRFVSVPLDYLLGSIFVAIQSRCKDNDEYTSCVQEQLSGDLGKFLMFAMHPGWISKQNSEFNEVFDACQNDVDAVADMRVVSKDESPNKVEMHPFAQAETLLEKEKAIRQSLDLKCLGLGSSPNERRALDFVKYALHKAGAEVEDIDAVQERISYLVQDIQRDAELMLRTYNCPRLYRHLII